jgi:hypothetical protein
LTTNNFSIIKVPTIVTDCSPFSFVKYFHPTNAGRALRSFQPECCGCKKMQLLLKFRIIIHVKKKQCFVTCNNMFSSTLSKPDDKITCIKLHVYNACSDWSGHPNTEI